MGADIELNLTEEQLQSRSRSSSNSKLPEGWENNLDREKATFAQPDGLSILSGLFRSRKNSIEKNTKLSKEQRNLLDSHTNVNIKEAGISALVDVINDEDVKNIVVNETEPPQIITRSEGVETPYSASTISTAFSVEEFRELAEQMEAAAEMERRLSVSSEEKRGKGKRVVSKNADNPPVRKPGRPRKSSTNEQQEQFDQSVVSPSAKWPAIVVGDPLKELQRACQYGQTVSVETMLKKGTVRVSDTDSNNNTALHEAAVYGKPEVVKVLIKYGSPLEPVNSLNETPLQLSRSPTVSLLLKEFITRMAASRPRLHFAVLSDDIELLKKIFSEGFESVNELDELGFSALHWCALKNRPDMIKCAHISSSTKLDLNAQSHDYKLTPLHEAARFNSPEAAQCLLDMGADPLLPDINGFIPLDYSPNKNMRRLFRRFGRKSNISELLRSPRLLSDAADDEEPASLNLEYGTDPPSSVGFTREERKLQQVLTILGRSESSPPKPIFPKKRGRPRTLKIDREKSTREGGGELRDKSTGRTLLHRYAAKGDIATMKDLMETEGALINVTDNAGYTALHEAALKGQLEAVGELIAAGAHVNAQANSNGDTALHDAAENGHAEIVKILLEAGADRNIENNKGFRALDVADGPELQDLLKIASGDHRSRATENIKEDDDDDQRREEPVVKRKPGRPRKHSQETEIKSFKDPLVLVNLDASSSSLWHFLSCQLEHLSPAFASGHREQYGRELNVDDRSRLLSHPAVSEIRPLAEALEDDHRSIYLLDKDSVYKAARCSPRFQHFLDGVIIQYIDAGVKSPASSSSSLPLKYKMKGQWKAG